MNLNQIDEMIGHLREIKKDAGSEEAVSAARAIGFFFDSLKEEMTPEINIHDDGEKPFFLNLHR